MQCGFGILPDDQRHPVFQLVELCSQPPCELRFHRLPQALDGIALGTLGRQEETDHRARDHERFRLMTTPMVHQHHMAWIPIVICKLMQKDLKVCCIEVW